MTEYEIRQLSGRELDAAVAEARGWKYQPQTDPKIHTWLSWRSPEGKARLSPPEVSTDIRAAWELVEEMIKEHGAKIHNGFMLVYDDRGTHPEDYWYCEFPEPWTEGSGSTAPEAICRAYLVAKAAD